MSSRPLPYMSAAATPVLVARGWGRLGGPWQEVVNPQLGESQRKPPSDMCPQFGVSRRIHRWEGKAFLVEGTAHKNAWRPTQKIKTKKNHKFQFHLKPNVASLHRTAFAGQDVNLEPLWCLQWGLRAQILESGKFLGNGGNNSL